MKIFRYIRRYYRQYRKKIALLYLIHRFSMAMSYYRKILGNIITWVFKSNEDTNFTYDLEDLNKKYLAAFVSHVCQHPLDKIESYFGELEDDQELRAHIANRVAQSKFSKFADTQMAYGRRLAWYALIRAVKPRIVVETGVDKGLGTCLIALALKRNSEERHPGIVYGTDINKDAGYLFAAPYDQYGKILYGDSIDSINKMEEKIDLFIHDSNHSAEYERNEYRAVQPKLSDRSIVISDNAHDTQELLDFALQTGRQFLYFKEKPKEHWYPGTGVGIAYYSDK